MLQIKHKLINNKAVIGAWVTIGHPEIAEVLLSTKRFDWLAIDMEHASPTTEQVAGIFLACKAYGVSPMVRLPNHDYYLARKVLDLGAEGIIIPVVESSETIDEIFKHTNYSPVGKRGACLSRINKWGDEFQDYYKNFKPLIIPQIESKNGVENIQAIANPDKVDAIFVGPYDLSADLNIPGNFDDEKFKSQMDNILAFGKDSTIPLGIHQVEPCNNQLNDKIKDGYRFIAFGTDAICMRKPLICERS